MRFSIMHAFQRWVACLPSTLSGEDRFKSSRSTAQAASSETCTLAPDVDVMWSLFFAPFVFFFFFLKFTDPKTFDIESIPPPGYFFDW